MRARIVERWRRRERYALATWARHRHVTRRQRPPVAFADPFLASIWPRTTRLWWPARAAWNGLRWLAARTWPHRWTGYRHPRWWRAGHLVWTIAALAAHALALTLTGMALAVWPAWWLSARLTGSALVLAGWNPPLTTRHLATPDTATWRETTTPAPRPVQSPPAVAAEADPWDWNYANDPQLALQREAVAELRRANDLAALHTQPPPAPPAPGTAWAPAPGYPQQVAARPAVRLTRSGQGAWWAAKSLLWLALVIGSLATFAAWALAFASAAGVIAPPPPLTTSTTPPAITTPTTGATP